MKEWIIDLYPIGGGFKTQTRLSAANQSAALLSARKLYPTHRTGSIKPTK
jgi:hypothetical protein